MPFLALSAVSSFLTFRIQQGAGVVGSLEALPLGFRVSNAAVSYVRYLIKTIWPTNLAVFYLLPSEWSVEVVSGKTRELALAKGQPEIARKAEERLGLYCSGSPYRDVRPELGSTDPGQSPK